MRCEMITPCTVNDPSAKTAHNTEETTAHRYTRHLSSEELHREKALLNVGGVDTSISEDEVFGVSKVTKREVGAGVYDPRHGP